MSRDALKQIHFGSESLNGIFAFEAAPKLRNWHKETESLAASVIEFALCKQQSLASSEPLGIYSSARISGQCRIESSRLCEAIKLIDGDLIA